MLTDTTKRKQWRSFASSGMSSVGYYDSEGADFSHTSPSTHRANFPEILPISTTMDVLSKRSSSKAIQAAGSDDFAPNNPLQSDFNADDSSSIDSDERYLVSSTEQKDG